MKLLTPPTSNAKIEKGIKYGYFTTGLHLAPYKLSGYNVCSKASPECIESCLNTAGHGAYSTTQEARIKRTKMLYQDRATFADLFCRDVDSVLRKAVKEGKQVAIRCNLTSDLPFEKIKLKDNKTALELYPNVIFYDYTKIIRRVRNKPDNLHLTFSRSESNDAECYEALANGVNVAVAMSKELVAQLDQFKGRLKLFDGDDSDLRFLDPKGKYGRIIYLRAKGKARKVKTEGFIMQSLEALQAFNNGFNKYLRTRETEKV